MTFEQPSTDGYVPTTDEVRSAYARLRRRGWRGVPTKADYARWDAELDRWLEQHDEETAADAWVEGLFVGLAGGHKDALDTFEAEVRAKVAEEIRAQKEHAYQDEWKGADHANGMEHAAEIAEGVNK